MIVQAKVRLEINPDKAKALGLRFCAERNARQLSPQDIADALLLSKLQVNGLETANHQSFYSAKMFGQAADKYAQYLGFEEKPSLTLFGSDPEPERALTEVEIVTEMATPTPKTSAPKTAEVNMEGTPRSSRFRVALVVLCVLGIVTLVYKATLTEPVAAAPQPEPVARTTEPNPSIAPPTPVTETASATPAPTVPTQNAPEKTEPVKTTPAEKPVASDNIAPGHILIKFNESSWVQSVDKNGSKQEKVYRPGDTLDLEPAKLQALVIGNAGAVIVNSSNAPISLKPYMASGSQVARIIGPDIRKLSE